MVSGTSIIDSIAADKGKDTYSQAMRERAGYSDCSSYLRRKYLALTGIDIGGYTTEIANNIRGRTLTASPSILRSGIGLQDADLVLYGWATDHRNGYPYSHIECYDSIRKGTWGQYGDIPPHNGPNFHTLDWGLTKADRILVRRFLPDQPKLNLRKDWVSYLQERLNAMFGTYSHLAVDGQYGPETRAVVTEFQRRTGLLTDGIVGTATAAKLAQYKINLYA